VKKIILLVLILVLVIGIIALFIYGSKPDKMTDTQKEKAIAGMLGRKVNTGNDVKVGNISFEGKYAQFSYPAAAVVYGYKGNEDMKNNDSGGDNFSFDLKNPRLVFNFTANKSTDVNLLDISSVKFRRDSANGYIEKEEKIGNVSALSFMKDRSGEFPAEKSIFLLSGGVLYTISITGSSIEEVSKLSDQIIASLSFK